MKIIIFLSILLMYIVATYIMYAYMMLYTFHYTKNEHNVVYKPTKIDELECFLYGILWPITGLFSLIMFIIEIKKKKG